MNVLFIVSMSVEFTSRAQTQLGVSHISSLLKSQNHKTKLLILTPSSTIKEIDDYINKFKPKLICFYSVATQYPLISKSAKYIKSHYPHIYLIAGGVHVSLNPEITINDSFDSICIGEGEYPTLELVNQLEEGKEPTKIKNLWIKRGNYIERNETREFIQNLDELPFPDRDIWEEYLNPNNKSKLLILLGRGCPFECTYCCNHKLKKLSLGKYTRYRSIKNIIEELKEITKKYPMIDTVFLQAETIGTDIPFAIDLCKHLAEFNEKYKKLKYDTNLRISPNKDYSDLFKNLKKANFTTIAIGIESGSQRVRKEILNRHYSNDDIINACNLARKYGLKIFNYIIMGFPGETLKEFKETVKLCRNIQPDGIQCNIFYPYKGTELYKLCKSKGYKDTETIIERDISVLDFPTFPKKLVEKEFVWFYYNVYKGHKPYPTLLKLVIKNKIKTSPFLNLFYRKINKHFFINQIRKLSK